MAKVKYSMLFDILRSEPNNYTISSCTMKKAINFLIEYIKEMFNIQFDASDLAATLALRKKVTHFCSTLKRKWHMSCCNVHTFLKAEKTWLGYELDLTEFSKHMRSRALSRDEPSTSTGTPSKAFTLLSERMKRKRTANLRLSAPLDELCHAAASSLYIAGKRSAHDLVLEATQYSPERPVKMRKKMQETGPNIQPYSADEALALLIDCRLSKSAYMQLRQGAASRGASIYPSYNNILAAKRASIPLQNLMDHTCRRIFDTLEFPDDENFLSKFVKIELFCKWGCDGSSGQNEYMQLFKTNPTEGEDTDTKEISEKHVFLFSMVPLRLAGYQKEGRKIMFWQNPKPSSVKYCRPIKFIYKKETTELVQREVAKVDAEIEELKPYEYFYSDSSLNVEYNMVSTMLDTKVISALTQSASQSCYICGCKPSQMNNLQLASNLSIKEEHLKYGLSTLHAWIKFLECVLHISYKLEFRKTTTRGASIADKLQIQARKSEIQESIWKELGLKVDRVLQGAGTSNTGGNVARRFFENPQKAADVTGVDVNLITKFYVILQVLSSGHRIKDAEFIKYCIQTAEMYVSLYNWYNMPPTVHKVMIHGGQVIRSSILPIGSLSEEAQETRNKDYRRYRKYHSRKTSRMDTTTDLLNTLLISSDPIISFHRKFNLTDSKDLHPEAKALLNIETNDDEFWE